MWMINFIMGSQTDRKKWSKDKGDIISECINEIGSTAGIKGNPKMLKLLSALVSLRK